MNLPKARTENLIEQTLDRETLIYDLNTHKAFNLNETSTIVYRACSDRITFNELKSKHQFNDDFILLALDELKKNNLLEENYQSPINGTNRREIIKKVGLATMFALPMITGLIAPMAANAASNTANTNTGGTGGSDLTGIYGGRCYSNGTCAPEYKCAPTTNGQVCCVGTNSGGGSRLLLPGESNSETYTGLGNYYTEPPAPYTCPASTCCSGSGVSGTCSYTLDAEQDAADATQPGDPYYGYHPYNLTCNCHCS